MYSREMTSLWQQEPSAYSPCVEIDSSTMRRKARVSSQSQHWLKQEHDDPEVIKWETITSGATSDVEQDNTPSSAVSSKNYLVKSMFRSITDLMGLCGGLCEHYM